MVILYKYMRREHARLLLEKGILRIGTLYEYRDTEKHGHAAGDVSEGIKTEYLDVHSEIWTAENQPEFSKSLIKIDGTGSHSINDLTLEKAHKSTDCYLYCMTEVFDENAMAEFGYDACVVIENAEKFFAAISRALRHKADLVCVARCQYTDRRKPHALADNIHPAWIKSPQYEYQREVRGLWTPKSKHINPIIIKCRRASKYCRLLKLPNRVPV